MDFLRRLDPGRAAAAGAARLDVVPRWLEPATAPLQAASERHDASDVPSAIRPLHAPAAWVPIDHAHPPRRNPDRARVEAAGAPIARPRTPSPDVVARPRPATAATAPPAQPTTVSPVSALESQVDGTRPDATRARPAPDAGPRPDAQPRSAASAPPRAVPDRPLRVDALVEQRSRPVSEPTIVHVTIDRIDVRLPAADVAPSPRERRPRAASAVAPLSEYLRGGGRA